LEDSQMLSLRLAVCVGSVFACFATAARAQQEELNARDAFWSAADLVGKHPSAAPVRKSAPVLAATPSKLVRTNAAEPKGSVTIMDAGLQKVSMSAPLGLRYSVLKRRGDGTFEEVPPDAAFHAGDRIRLSVMSNQESYLHIIEQGTSGKWRPLYPPANDTPTKLTAGQEYLIPGGPDEFFQFSGDPGQEKLFVLLSRTPQTNLDQTIEALRNRQSSGINDQLVAELRGEVQSRDLVFTKFDDDQKPSTSSAQEDKATYVVNKATNKTADPHIVVDVVLSHR
jgi:hypothetical protein